MAPEIIAACFGNSSVGVLIDFGNRKELPKPPRNIQPKRVNSLDAIGIRKNTKLTTNGAIIYSILVLNFSANSVNSTRPMVIPPQNNESPNEAFARDKPPSFSRKTDPKFPKVASQAPYKKTPRAKSQIPSGKKGGNFPEL